MLVKRKMGDCLSIRLPSLSLLGLPGWAGRCGFAFQVDKVTMSAFVIDSTIVSITHTREVRLHEVCTVCSIKVRRPRRPDPSTDDAKRRRRTQRRRKISEKRSCSDTIEESSSSADEACSFRYIQSDTSLHLHITTFRARECSAHDTWHHERASVHYSVTRSLRLKLEVSHDLCRPSLALALLNNLGHGGYARVRLGELQNSGPATHDRDRATAQQRTASLRRINEAGDSVPGSHIRYAGDTHRSFSSSTAADAQLSETFPGAAETAALRAPSVCAVWLRSRRLQSSLRPRPRAAHGSEKWGTTTAFRKRWAAAPSRPYSLYSLRHHLAAAMSPMHLLRK